MRWQVPVYASLMFAGAAVAASAQSIEAVIVGRCVTGLGGAGVFQWYVDDIYVCILKQRY